MSLTLTRSLPLSCSRICFSASVSLQQHARAWTPVGTMAAEPAPLIGASGDAGGRDDTFQSSDIMCAICCRVLSSPLRARCRHRFCQHCITTLFVSSREACPPCPLCRKPIHRNDLQPENDAELLQRIDESECACVQAAFGCAWHGVHRDLSAHLETCCFVPCSNRELGCTWIGSAGERLLHETSGCETASLFDSTSSVDSTSGPTTIITAASSSSSTTSSESSQQSTSTRSIPLSHTSEIASILSSKVYALDVGGRVFHASEDTLRRERGSLLDELFSGAHLLPRQAYVSGHDASVIDQASPGVLFLDCDATSFEHVLFWLRQYVSV